MPHLLPREGDKKKELCIDGEARASFYCREQRGELCGYECDACVGCDNLVNIPFLSGQMVASSSSKSIKPCRDGEQTYLAKDLTM